MNYSKNYISIIEVCAKGNAH